MPAFDQSIYLEDQVALKREDNRCIMTWPEQQWAALFGQIPTKVFDQRKLAQIAEIHFWRTSEISFTAQNSPHIEQTSSSSQEERAS